MCRLHYGSSATDAEISHERQLVQIKPFGCKSPVSDDDDDDDVDDDLFHVTLSIEGEHQDWHQQKFS